MNDIFKNELLQNLNKTIDELQRYDKKYAEIIKNASEKRWQIEQRINANYREIDELISCARNNGVLSDSVEQLLEMVADEFMVNKDLVRLKKPKGVEVQDARHWWIYLCWKLHAEDSDSLNYLGLDKLSFFLGITHPTVISSRKAILGRIECYKKDKELHEKFISKLNTVGTQKY